MTSPSIARRFLSVLEPCVAFIYFSPEANEEYAALGIEPVPGYFLSRSAPMGAATPATVASAFYNFNPVLIQNVLSWDGRSPADVGAARDRGVIRGLTRMLDGHDRAQIARADELMREIATVGAPEGRPLYAAFRGLPWPSDLFASFWHGGNLLREYRGDGHIAVLVSHGVSGIESLVLHAPYLEMGEKRHKFLYGSRMWGDEAYSAAAKSLGAHGFLDDEGKITDAGVKFRDMLELETDRLAMPPFDALGAERCEELIGLLGPIGARIVEDPNVPHSLSKAAKLPA